MVKTLLLSVLFIFQTKIFCQTAFLDIEKILRKPSGNISELNNLIEKNKKGFPLIYNNRVMFLYKGEATIVRIAGDFTNWEPEVRMTNLIGTNVFYKIMEFEMDARLDYKIVVNKDWILDPLNEKYCEGGYGVNSELRMPAYKENEIFGKTVNPTPLIEDSIKSKIMERTYKTFVYLPDGYKNKNSKFPVVYFQDGTEYIKMGEAVKILDILIQTKKIMPVIAVFVVPTNRNDEYAFYDKDNYTEFFAKELVNTIDLKYKTIKSKESRALIGDSFGGNISAIISYKYSDMFGKCGMHSAAFWPEEYAAFKLITNPVKDIQYAFVWGTYEKQIADNMKEFVKIIEAAKGKFYYKEYHQGHSWGLWRNTLPDLLKEFFGIKK